VTVSLSLPRGSTVPGVNYRLAGGVFSDPIGPYVTTTGTGPGTTGTTGTTAPLAPTTPTSPTTGLTTTTDPMSKTVSIFTITAMRVLPVLSFPYSF